MSKMTIGYSSYENRNYEEPMVESGPTEHMTKTGVIVPLYTISKSMSIQDQRILCPLHQEYSSQEAADKT